MNAEYWPEVESIKSVVFGVDKPCKSIYVYLHGSGGFGTDYKGQFEYPDFPSLLRDGEMNLEQPFVVACCMHGEYWSASQLASYFTYLKERFGADGIDVIGYSRGGAGVYDLLQAGVSVNSAVVINSRLPEALMLSDTPVHIIHATDDQFTPLGNVKLFVKRFGPEKITFTEWQGDHYSIAAIAQSDIWQRKK